MALIQGWLPPSRENWEMLSWFWQFFPLVTVIQWLTDFYPQGKTSIDSLFNIPGHIAWFTMEAPGFLLLLYIMSTLPRGIGLTASLPLANWVMAGMFTIHYIYRAILAPLVLNPSMSPVHPLVWLSALAFQVANAVSIGGWLGGHGPVMASDWSGRHAYMAFGTLVWLVGFVGNFIHDDVLREIRRAAARTQQRREQELDKGGNQATKEKKKKDSVDKVYMIPQTLLFRWIFYPHYVCEWIEWAGFWIFGGRHCVPARSFLLNEISTMTPRALLGRRWYLQRFGPAKVKGRRAVIPGLL